MCLSSDTGQGEAGMMVLQEEPEEVVREPAASGGSIDSAAWAQAAASGTVPQLVAPTLLRHGMYGVSPGM